MSKLNVLLMEPRLRGVDLLGPERLKAHSDVLLKKSMIRGVFEEFYRKCRSLDDFYFGNTPGSRIEIGAGTSFFKKLYPDTLSTDVEPSPLVDQVVNAQSMPFENDSVRCFYCINCFHHFSEPQKFFDEVLRTTQPGGGCVIIEPYFGFLSRLLYKKLFETEGYDTKAGNWGYISTKGMDGLPNQALSYLVFFRDRSKFQELYPQLEIVKTDVFGNYPRYLLSGGLNFRQLIPDWSIPFFKVLEYLAAPLRASFGLHHVIVLRHRAGN